MYQTLQVRSGRPYETPGMLQAADGDANAKPTEGNVAPNPGVGARAEPPIFLPSDTESTNQASAVLLVSDAFSGSQDPETTDSPKPSPEYYNEGPEIFMIRQLEMKIISQQDLVKEAKEIYKALSTLESKCIEVVSKVQGPLNDEHFRFLGGLHKALLHEHSNFYGASHYPCAKDSLKNLASKYNMPSRMWQHGIQAYLDLLRQLPESREHMLCHIRLSWHLLTALYESVSCHAGTFAECLGDLARYGMTITDGDDREMWTEASKQWYDKASDLSPGTGRLYHHMAVLARPDRIQQLFYYSKALCVLDPFENTRESILTLFKAEQDNEQGIGLLFVQCHACMFTRSGEQNSEAFRSQLYHSMQAADPSLQSAYIGIANCCAMVEYGDKSNIILQIINGEPDDTVVVGKEESDDAVMVGKEEPDDTVMVGKEEPDDTVVVGREESPDSIKSSQLTAEFAQARYLAFSTARLMFSRIGDSNVWPCMHVMLVFVDHLRRFSEKGGMAHVEQDFPWSFLVNHLNAIRLSGAGKDDSGFPGCTPLAEDFAMRGLPWAAKYHPDGWFGKEADDAKMEFEMASGSAKRLDLSMQRRVRILWLGRRIAGCERWIRYDSEGGTFSVMPDFEKGK